MCRAALARMLPQDLRNRLIEYARLVATGIRPLLGHMAAGHAARQTLRASASGAANYRAACLARSHDEFRAKLGLALEEIDESVFWLEYLRLTEFAAPDDLNALIAEGQELAAILGASKRTSAARAHLYTKHKRR
jgi:four helix bundle protein